MILSSPLPGPGADPAALGLGACSIVALAGYVFAVALTGRNDALARWTMLAAWLAQGAAIAVDLMGLGSTLPGARFGFGPVLSATAWLVLAVYAVESRLVPMPDLQRTLALIAAAAVAVAWAFPADLRPHVASPWAPLHWLLGVASYGLFGAAVFHGALLNRAERQLRERGRATTPGGVPLLRLERLTFHFIAAGFVALSAALVAGVWFATPWRWDHKTVFSMLSWVVFAGLLIGRHAFGWRGTRATRWLYAGALLLLLAYVGSRFVIEVLLHRSTPVALG